MLDYDACAFEAGVTGVPMARIPAVADGIQEDLLSQLVEQAKKEGMFHLVTTVEAGAIAQANLLAEAQFSLVDVSVVFVLDPEPSRRETAPPSAVMEESGFGSVRAGRRDDLEPIQTACETVFRGSRYYADSFFREAEANALHALWIKNLFNGRAQSIWVAEADHVPVGFAALRVFPEENAGHIELIAVAKKVSGSGLGKKLVAASLNWFADRVGRVFVKTQIYNQPACRLYQRAGFITHRAELTYARTLQQR